jgi:hypothetical protein
MKPAFLILTILHGFKAAGEAHVAHQIPDRSREIGDTLGEENVLHEEKIEPVVDVDRPSALPTNYAN